MLKNWALRNKNNSLSICSCLYALFLYSKNMMLVEMSGLNELIKWDEEDDVKWKIK